VKVYGLEMAREMLAVETNDERRTTNDDVPATFVLRPSSIVVTGYIGSPSLHRGNRGYITLFVNRRWFQDTSIAYSVIQAYHTMLLVGRYPVAVIFIEIPPEEVDVNVHPTKAEVRFRESGTVFSAVQKAVRRTLTDHAPIPQVELGGAAAGSPAPDTVWLGSEEKRPTPFGGQSWSARRDALLAAGQHRFFASPGLNDQTSGVRGQESTPADQADAAVDPASEAHPSSFSPHPSSLLPLLRVVGQLGATYIVAEGPDGMYLIDQHAAHERVLYEQMLAEHDGNRLAVQPLLEPLVLDLTPEQAAVVAEELDTLGHLGVEIEPFGGASYLVRSLPAILGRENPYAALSEIVDGMTQRDDLVEATREARLVTLICKRAAIKGNSPLSMAEMQELVRRLEGCRSPRTCPHGRPTMVYLSSNELARQFGRV
jgi:DNA mismatch repair protein MutL